MAATAALSVLAVACDGGGGGSGSGTTAPEVTSTTAEFVQHRFHELIANGVRNRMVQLVPDRFRLDEGSVVEVDLYPDSNANQRVEFEFETQKELNEFAVEQGMIGFYNADFTASGGQEFWGIFTQVFRDLDGPPVVFERFGLAEALTIDDAERVSDVETDLGGGAPGRVAADTYRYEDGSQVVAMRGTVVDTNALHFVSAIVDVPAGVGFDGGAEMRRVLTELVGLHRALFEEFLRLGGEDTPPDEEG